MTRIVTVVPVLNEEVCLALTLGRLRECGLEVIVVDGGSTDATVTIAEGLGARVLVSPPGRARQMNLGAAMAEADVLFFVHADSIPPRQAQPIINHTLGQPGVAAGAFRLAIESRDPRLRLINFLANIRSRWVQLPYGDQGIFLKKETFQAIGGYSDIPIMEDVDLIRRLKKKGRIITTQQTIKTSARRWNQKGAIVTSVQNLARLVKYYLGQKPQHLAKHYENIR